MHDTSLLLSIGLILILTMILTLAGHNGDIVWYGILIIVVIVVWVNGVPGQKTFNLDHGYTYISFLDSKHKLKKKIRYAK